MWNSRVLGITSMLNTINIIKKIDDLRTSNYVSQQLRNNNTSNEIQDN